MQNLKGMFLLTRKISHVSQPFFFFYCLIFTIKSEAERKKFYDNFEYITAIFRKKKKNKEDTKIYNEMCVYCAWHFHFKNQ